MSGSGSNADPKNEKKAGSTPVPPRGGSKKTPPKQRSRAQAQRRRRGRQQALIALSAVVVVIVALVVVKLTGSSSSGPPREPVPAALAAHVTSVPLSTLVQAASKVSTSTFQPANPINAKPYTVAGQAGKPGILYIGAEFCPICATERWAMVVALSHFGTFSNLSQTHSALRDGDISTFSFYGSSFKSSYLAFDPVETTTNQPSGSYYKTLETPTSAQKAVWTAQEGSNLAFPFLYLDGKLVLETAQFPPQALTGRSFTSIANAIGSNDNTVGLYVDAAAAQLIKYICSITSNKPASVCSAVADVALPPPTNTGQSSSAG